MRTLSYVGRGWWGKAVSKFKKAEDAIKVYGKTNVSRIGPGVWLCIKNGEPAELILMEREETARKRIRATAKPKAVAIPVVATMLKGNAKKAKSSSKAPAKASSKKR